ncbi:MAG: NAD(P)/FAD-dependent oxidoreductase [Geminicoccaceae bacterium]
MAVVGGGVVGCAVARRLALAGRRTILLERGPDILTGASKANSAILHTGFDAPPGSLELACMREGYAEYVAIRERLGLPLLVTGAAVVAWSEADLARLDGIEAQARGNGVDEVRRIDRAELLAREPRLSPDCWGALLVPGEHVIDPWSAPLAYLHQAVAHGAAVRFDAEVTGGVFASGAWALGTTAGPVAAGWVINCAGLFGDRLEERLLGDAAMRILPRKGQFVVFDKPAAALLRTTILPVPGERTKGVVLVRTVFGNLLVGPTAEEQDDRERATVEHGTLRALVERAVAMLPALAAMPVTATYAGLRPATERKEYRLRHEPDRHWLTIGGIRSTGLTAALGLAAHAARLLGLDVREPRIWPHLPNLADDQPRDWQRPDHGDMVCHCELVTRREIEAALCGPLPARDLGGLKRRTRAAMGRCQGFYCGAELARMTEGRLAVPLAVASRG